MRRLIVLLICTHIICSANSLDLNTFRGEDAVVVEALEDDDIEIETTTGTSGSARDMSDGSSTQTTTEGPYCVTNTGLSGSCEAVQECFPRLFPVDSSDPDRETPKGTGAFNQNLLSLLIGASGFCGASKSRQSDATTYQGPGNVCCASGKVEKFPLEPANDTSVIDSRVSCGNIKVDPKTLPLQTADNDRVVGGRPAVLGEYPWMVAMMRKGQQFCGASLIDSRNILTAAHCVEFMTRNDVKSLVLQIGDLDILSTSETKHIERKAKRVLYHKGFNMKHLEHDIALIHLDRPVEFSKTVQPVCLHPGNPRYDTGKEFADVSGWGTTSSGGSQSSKLLTVRIQVIPQDDCNKKYSQSSKKIGPGMVCAGSKGKDSCQGDSGGPLVLDPRGQARQIGIVSWGIGCASYPGVYTRVDRYMKWINKNRS